MRTDIIVTWRTCCLSHELADLAIELYATEPELSLEGAICLARLLLPSLLGYANTWDDRAAQQRRTTEGSADQ